MRPETRSALDELDPKLRQLESWIEHGRAEVERLEEVLTDARALRRRLLNNDRRISYWERQTAESKALLAEVRAETAR